MEFLKSVYEWVMGPNGVILFAVLFGISEALSAIPSVNSNGVYQFIRNAIKWCKEKIVGAQPAVK